VTDGRWVVHKFGGTSVADANRYRRVAEIVGGEWGGRPAVVVSAMSGVTDVLVRAVELASVRAPEYADELAQLRARHRDAIEDLLAEPAAQPLLHRLEQELAEIADVLRVCSLLRSHSRSAMELVIGHGEIWSARLLAAYLSANGRDAVALDAREVLVVEPVELSAVVDWDASRAGIERWRSSLDRIPEILIITGFVASDTNGVPTTLGRNGSDFTATIFGALLGADAIHIWTDVDGVMSADPRLVPEAVRIEALSYHEAMELAYFGAKVVHPSTMAPAIERGLPIYIRNTFNPAGEGTCIHHGSSSGFGVKGLTTITSVALINVEGTGLIGVPGTAERLFGALREAGISVVMISQGSSEHSICFAVHANATTRARKAIERAFFAELHHGQIQTIDVDPDCCILAAVGDEMAGHPGIAATFFAALARAGVNIRAIAQGSSERNISVVVEAADVVRALRAAHSGFYLSRQTISIGVIGTGVVGGTLLDQLAAQADRLREETGVDLRVRGIATSRRMHLADRRIELDGWRDALANEAVAVDPDEFVAHIHADHLPHTVLVDCTASAAIAHRYPEWLRLGIHVITPNKRAGTAPLLEYAELLRAGRESGMHYLYETTVGAGLPVIQTLRDLVRTGDDVLEIEGIFSGTLAYLFNIFDGSRPFSAIVEDARRRGYTEPDPRDDLSGMDVARKVVILAREVGLKLEVEDVEIESLVPGDLTDHGVDEFLAELPRYDEQMRAQWEEARERGTVLRYVGSLDREGRASVRLREYPKDHSFANIRLTDNIVLFRTRRYHDNPLVVQGPGAGPEVTAGGVFADLLRLSAYLGGRP
jgi:bifunctional aspartokinase / homoserine dehydrogenase 1